MRRALAAAAALCYGILVGATAFAQDAPFKIYPQENFVFTFGQGQPIVINVNLLISWSNAPYVDCCPSSNNECYVNSPLLGQKAPLTQSGSDPTVFSANLGSYSGDSSVSDDMTVHLVCGWTIPPTLPYFNIVLTRDYKYTLYVSCNPPAQSAPHNVVGKGQAAMRRYTPRPNESCECQAFTSCGGEWIQYPGGAPCCNHVVCSNSNGCCNAPGVVQCG